MSIKDLIEDSLAEGRIKNDLILCDNCDNPASYDLSNTVGWIGCAFCITGEVDSFDIEDLIHIDFLNK